MLGHIVAVGIQELTKSSLEPLVGDKLAGSVGFFMHELSESVGNTIFYEQLYNLGREEIASNMINFSKDLAQRSVNDPLGLVSDFGYGAAKLVNNTMHHIYEHPIEFVANIAGTYAGSKLALFGYKNLSHSHVDLPGHEHPHSLKEVGVEIIGGTFGSWAAHEAYEHYFGHDHNH